MLEDSYRLTQSVQDLCRPSRKSTANVPKVFKFPRLSQWAEPRAAPPLRTSATLGRPGALAVLLVSAPTPYSEVRKDKTTRTFNPRVVLRRFTERRCVTVIRMTKRKIALRLKRTAPGPSGAAAQNGKRTGSESMPRVHSCTLRVEDDSRSACHAYTPRLATDGSSQTERGLMSLISKGRLESR